MPDPYCDHLQSPNPWALGLSIFLVLGILVSYLPQHAKIIHNQTSAGLSPYWVLLGALSSIAGITNILVLPSSRHDMACCREISATSCGAAVLGVVQIGVQWVCFMLILILYLVYFPHDSKATVPVSDTELLNATEPAPRSIQAVLVGATNFTALLLAGIVTLILMSRAPSYLLGWANFLGTAAGVLSCIQYLPQIYTTYRLQHLLSLSVMTLLLQVPGGFLFAFSLFLRVGWAGWSAWLVYCVTATCQAVLLTLAIMFYIRDTNDRTAKGTKGSDTVRHADDVDHLSGPTETDALLPSTPRMDSETRRSAYEGSTLRTINGNPKNPIGLLYSASPPDDSSLPSDVESSPASRTQRT